MPTTETGRGVFLPYYRTEERGYWVNIKANFNETGEYVFGLPAFSTTPTTPASQLFTEIGTVINGTTFGHDETGQVVINFLGDPTGNPKFFMVTEVGLHVISPYHPFLDYFRPSQGSLPSSTSGATFGPPSNQVGGLPGSGFEIVTYPLDKDDDIVTTTKPTGVG